MRLKKRGLAAAAVLITVACAAMAVTGTGPAGGATTPPGGTWGTPQAIPGLAALGYNTNAVTSLDCGSAGNCAAVGWYIANGTTSPELPFAVIESGGVWGNARAFTGIPGASSSGNSTLTKVTCAGSGSCAAAGAFTAADGGTHVFLVSESGGTWGTPTALDESALTGATSTTLGALSCPAAGGCTAVGTYSIPGPGTAVISFPFAVDENAGTWGRAQPVAGVPASVVSANLDSLSCAAPGDCTAGGSYAAGTAAPYHALPFTVTESGHEWGQLELVPGFAALESGAVTGGSITGVACPIAGTCAAIGFAVYVNAGVTLTPAFTIDETNGSWGQAQLLSLSGAASVGPSFPPEVACRVAGDCVAAMEGPAEVLTTTESSAGTWTAATPVSGESAGGSELEGLACTSEGDCVVAGYTVSGKTSLSSDSYETFTATSPPGAGFGVIQPAVIAVGQPTQASFACPQAGYCVLSDRIDGIGNVQSLINEATASTLTLTPSATALTYGAEQSETLTATVSSPAGGTPTGTVTVTSGTAPVCVITLAAGSGSCALTGAQLPAGSYPLTVSYSGDGYYLPSTFNSTGGVTLTVAAPTVAGTPYTPVAPLRVLDTRNGTGGYSSPVGAGKAISLQVTGRDGVPASGVTAVVLNLTATGSTASSWVIAYPDGHSRPATGSNLNFTKGETIPNLVTVPVGADGKIDLYNNAGTVNLVADLQGYYSTSGQSLYTAAGPVRILDTRNGTGGYRSPVGSGKAISLQVTGRDGVPASGVTAVVLNVTATGPTTSGWVIAYPDGQPRPADGSDLNFTKGETIPNQVIVSVGADGKIDLYNYAGTVNLVADLQGYYTTTGGSEYTTAGPVRILDTRNGTGGYRSPVGSGKAISLQVTGQDGVPASGVTAVVLNVTATGPTTSGWVIAYPDGQNRPAEGSDLNFTKGETIPNQVIVPVGADGKIDLYNYAGSVNLVADLEGYFAG